MIFNNNLKNPSPSPLNLDLGLIMDSDSWFERHCYVASISTFLPTAAFHYIFPQTCRGSFDPRLYGFSLFLQCLFCFSSCSLCLTDSSSSIRLNLNPFPQGGPSSLSLWTPAAPCPCGMTVFSIRCELIEGRVSNVLFSVVFQNWKIELKGTHLSPLSRCYWDV